MSQKKILTFRASSIGDSLMAKFFLENIRAHYPDAQCGIVVAGRGAMIRDLLEAYPWIEVIEANRKDILGLWRLWRRFRRSDIVLTQYAGKGGIFSLRSKIAARILAKRGGLIGYTDASPINKHIYNILVPMSTTRSPRLLELDALNALHNPVATSELSLSYNIQPGLLEKLNLSQHAYVVVHLFAGSGGRALSPSSRQKLVDTLATSIPETPLIFTGSASERPHIESLQLPTNARVVAGNLTVQELIALIDSSKGMISVGTGPSHIASHLGTPLLVLVICYGIPWCDETQFGKNAGEIWSNTEACKGHHNMSNMYPDCIETLNMKEVGKCAGVLFGP